MLNVRNELEYVAWTGLADRVQVALRIEAHTLVRLQTNRRASHRRTGLRIEFIDEPACSFLGDEQGSPGRPDYSIESTPSCLLGKDMSFVGFQATLPQSSAEFTNCS